MTVHLESDECESSTATRALVSHDSYVNDVPYLSEVIFQVSFSGGIQNAANEVLHVDRLALLLQLPVNRNFTGLNLRSKRRVESHKDMRLVVVTLALLQLVLQLAEQSNQLA